MRRWWAYNGGTVAAVAGMVAIVGVIVGAIVFAVLKHRHWTAQCHEQGGHVVSVDRSAVCVGSDGRYLGKE